MKITDILYESPLPDDWDKDTFSSGSFKKRIDYAKQKSQRIGGGSSRVAFLIKYQGRDTVLKIAKNKKGLAQNYQETNMMRSADVLGASGSVVVPMIDHDEIGEDPSWLHVEYARTLKSEKEFLTLTGFKLNELLDFAAYHTGNRSVSRFNNKQFTQEFKDRVWDEDSYGYDLVYFIGNTKIHLPDLYRVNNWGVYKNRPVIIDLGLDQEVFNTHYRANF